MCPLFATSNFDQPSLYCSDRFNEWVADDTSNEMDLLIDACCRIVRRFDICTVPCRVAARAAKLNQERFQLALHHWCSFGIMHVGDDCIVLKEGIVAALGND